MFNRQSLRVSLIQLKLVFDLLRVRILDLRTLKWFLLSIITISTLFTVSSSFLLGFQNQQLFTDGSAPNVLIISQPKITPAESQIPLFWINDIQQLPGISVISPETVDVVIDQTNGQTPYFRGVTDNFRTISTKFSMVSGNYFDTNPNSTSNEIIVGQNYAKLFHIHIGDTIVLQSRPKSVIIDATVTGIFSTGTIADDGILGPLWMGRSFAGLTSNLVNIIRIKFDTSMYTKTELQNIILNDHSIQVTATNPYNYNVDMSKTSVILFNRYKQQINQSFVDSYNSAYFTVPFGQYYLELTNPAVSFTRFTSIFIEKDQAFNLPIGLQYANFTASFSISNELKSNASVQITNININEQFNFTTNSQGEINGNLPLGSLNILFKWKNYQNSTIVDHESIQSITINFDYSIHIQLVAGATNTSLSNKKIVFTNLETNRQIIGYSDSNGFISKSLQPDTPYTILSPNTNYFRNFTLSNFNETSFDFFLGQITINVQVLDVNVGNLANYPVQLFIRNQTMTINSNVTLITDQTGIIHFTASSGSIVSLMAIYGTKNATFTKNLLIQNINFYKFYLGKQEFFFTIADYNTTNDNMFPINVVVSNLNSSYSTNFILDSTNTYKLFLNFGNYSVSYNNVQYSIYEEINFNSSVNDIFTISFNQFKLDLTFFTQNGTLFSGNFQFLDKNANGFVPFRSFQGSHISMNLQNGLYKIILQNNYYSFEKTLSIHNQSEIHNYFVSQDAPVIKPINFGNFTVSNSSVTLFISLQNSKLTQFKWNNDQYQNYYPKDGIIPPSSEGLSKLTILSTNYDNITTQVIYWITVDNTGPIPTLLTLQGNNSRINFNYVPKFSFSETPKNTYYTWNTTNITTSNPTMINTTIQGPQKLTLKLVNYAGKINYFYYIFFFDNVPPQLVSSNPSNHSTVTTTNISLTFSEKLSLIHYSWNGAFFVTGTSVIPVPAEDGLNYNLTIYFIDLAGNFNETVLQFPIIDHVPAKFNLINFKNTTFTQINDSRIYFDLLNSNETLLYSWNNNPLNSYLHIKNNAIDYLIPPYNTNGIQTLNVTVFDTYNQNDFNSHIYYFTTDFDLPQFNISLSSAIGPNQTIKILFPNIYSNWTYNWDNGVNTTGSTSFALLNASTTIGIHSLNLQLYFTNNTLLNLVYNITVQNQVPELSIKNQTYLSSNNSYTLDFPSYVSNWTYYWNISKYYSGSNTTTKLYVPSNLIGNTTLFVNYNSTYGVNSSFQLSFILDSTFPQFFLNNTQNLTPQRSGFIPKVNFSESVIQVYYSWNGGNNLTYISPMPLQPDNTSVNLIIYAEDQGNNWNSTVFTFFEDNTPIGIQLDPNNSTVNNNYVKPGDGIIFDVTESPALIYCIWNNVTSTSCSTFNSSSLTIIVPVIPFNGSISFIIRIYDSAGNENGYTLTLDSYRILPTLINSNLQNNTIINSDFVLNYSFSKSIISSNSLYSWDSFGNITGFPTINTSLNGEHTLNWWFCDSSGACNHYLFNVLIDTQLPSFILSGNYSSNLIITNASLYLVPIDESNIPVNVYIKWNTSLYQYMDSPVNSALNISLPPWIGNSTLQISIEDNYNNWLNETLLFMIQPYLNIELRDTNNNPIPNIILDLFQKQSNIPYIYSTSNKLSTFVDPANYTLVVQFKDYNLTTNLNLLSSSISKTIFLRNLTLQLTNSKQLYSAVGRVQWNDGIMFSTVILVNGSDSVYASLTTTIFTANINNETFQRTLDLRQKINAVNFTNQFVLLTLKLVTSQNSLPIQNVIIKNNQQILGLTNSNGTFSKEIKPGSYSLSFYYAIFQANLPIDIYENQNHVITLSIYSNITISVNNQDTSPAEGITVSLYSAQNEFIDSKITNFDGIVIWNNIPWGLYNVKIKSNTTINTYNITISSISDQNNNIFTFILPSTNSLLSAVGNNLGKWSFNRNYELVAPSELSDKTLQNLGFSVIFPTLLLIIFVMTILGIMSVLHQPIFKLNSTIRDLKRLGATKEQILSIVSFQFSVITAFLALIGYCIGFVMIIFWPNLQQLPIAGMIIRPEINNVFVPILISISFGLITSVFTYNYTKREYFPEKSKKND